MYSWLKEYNYINYNYLENYGDEMCIKNGVLYFLGKR